MVVALHVFAMVIAEEDSLENTVPENVNADLEADTNANTYDAE